MTHTQKIYILNHRYNNAPYRTKITHLLLQKWRVHRETGPEVSQQLSSSCIKMLQLSLDIIGDHL